MDAACVSFSAGVPDRIANETEYKIYEETAGGRKRFSDVHFNPE